ncbi:MATE family efflux transporter [Neptuniibacter halophilus]|uniref:MATE family efflux transporter n=1 Tax=Neptuniibacter halophilus TaxID=651666 RepID=UPI00257393DE|nr:MATE family efflux transporter [Neptuniibacter halophilus]
MTSLQRQKIIFTLGLPIIAGMLSQSVLNLIDAALVGRLGEASLAGVGIGGYANFVVISLILGLSSAVQALVARRRGEGRAELACHPVYAGVLISFLIALPLSLLFISHSEWIISLMTDDPAVQEIASGYFDYRTAAMLAVGLNLSFRGWWNGSKRPYHYFRALLITHLLNVIISYCLIFGEFGLPRLGAQGAGLGSAIALFSGALLNGFLFCRDPQAHRQINWFNLLPGLRQVIQLAVPHSLQQLFLALAICILIWIIGQLGTNEQAIAHVLINLSLFLILPAVGFGVASTSLISHDLGAGRVDAAAQWGWDVVKTALSTLCLLSLPLWFLPQQVLAIFLTSAPLIEQASLPLQLTALAICLDAAALVLTQSLLGVGANRTVLLISTFGQWCFFLPLAWLFGPILGFGLIGIWLMQVLHRAASSVLFMRIWSQQNWQKIRI